MGNLQKIVYLSQAEYETLVTNGTITKDGVTITYSQDDLYITPEPEPNYCGWYTGTAITGTSETAAIFSNSGITYAMVGDMYLNTSTSNTYRCTTAGAASVAEWVYVNNIKGAGGATGTTFTPSVSSAGVISWTNDGGATNPSSVDLVAAVIAALPTAVGVEF